MLNTSGVCLTRYTLDKKGPPSINYWFIEIRKHGVGIPFILSKWIYESENMSQTAHSMQCNVLVCITTTAGSVMATSNLKPTNYEFKVVIKSLQETY